MRKLLIALLIFWVICSHLNAKRLYFDVGLSSDITKNEFDFTGISLEAAIGGAMFGIKTTYTVSSEGIDGKNIDNYNHYSYLNLNARLGYRVNDKFVLISEYQTIGINEDFYWRVSTTRFWGLGTDIFDYKMTMKPIRYIGGGFMYYPHSKLQFGITTGDARSGLILEAISENAEDGSVSDCLSFGLNMSMAYDMPIKNFGLLIGSSFFTAFSKDAWEKPSPTIFGVTSIGLFTKIRY
ncbi:MAG: hypothetical protein FWG98_09875 [Candidatus Cloacimonetes bacterium]|nr:hypothetical protein [Candidatus Cloacimonadota bacterium]